MIFGMKHMVRIEQLAVAAVQRDAVALRSLAQDLLRENVLIKEVLSPDSNDPVIRAIAASLVELFADQRRELPPPWAAEVAALDRPVFLVEAVATMPRLRRLCETESPAPLRRRNLLAPPNFLQFV